ncbi:hypothetical protein F2P56_033668 [Juglans regia]|uniref:Pectinesterase inhibitor domain-containing protein n=2 Tax=Juglans regia TaxID=51240 RepID=A0A833TQ07_JUGRE|nr:uncharacterized protein LOC108981530 [Juglans regia]KAF5444544.1 hypothetical protein F2P56_033668 [Juglans regia]
MVSQVHAVLLMLSLSILVFSQSFLPANAAKNLVPDVCRETISYAGCMHAFQSDPRAKTASNFMDLAKIALELGLKNAIDSKAYIDGLLEKNHAAPIKKCSFWYEAVVGSFQSALSELKEDALTANYDVKIAGDDAASCENELASGGVKVPSISARNNDVALYSNIGDVITNKL